LYPGTIVDGAIDPRAPIVATAARHGVLELPPNLGSKRYEVFLIDQPVAFVFGGTALDGAWPHTRAVLPVFDPSPAELRFVEGGARSLPPVDFRVDLEARPPVVWKQGRRIPSGDVATEELRGASLALQDGERLFLVTDVYAQEAVRSTLVEVTDGGLVKRGVSRPRPSFLPR